MLDPEEIRWVKSTANELNNLLQVISESSQLLENISAKTSDGEKYFAILRSGVDRATKVTRMMVDRVGGYNADPLPAPSGSPATAAGISAPAANASPAASGPPPSSVQPPKPAAAPMMRVVPRPPPAEVKINNPTGPRELVMIVDDEDFVTLLAQRVLADEGYRVVTAKDGFQAIELYRKLGEQIALIILDFTMPVMDGSDVFAELLEINPQVPVVLSSGFAEQERLRGMLAKGLRGFIPKPYTQQKLLTQIRSTLDTLQAERTGERRVL
jgi:CheY-like chemotaxis protein